MAFYTFVVFTILSLQNVQSEQETTVTRAEFLKALLYDYDYQIPPNYESDDPCTVVMSLFVENFHSISESDMEFVADLVIEQKWIDMRLNFMGLVESPYLEIDSKMMHKIWIPDLYIPNEKSAYSHVITVPNKMLHLYSNGSVVYKSRISLTASCYMNLRKYPMDKQTCSLFFQSFAYSTKTVVFAWDFDPINTRGSFLKALPKFEIANTSVGLCKNIFDDSHTCISAHFYLQRNLGFYVIQVYIPTILIVVVSWISFWLNKDAVPARTTLGILTILTITTHTSAAVAALPQVSYIKAIDIWMAVCLGFVFAAFLEYAVLQFTIRTKKPTDPTSAPAYIGVPTKDLEDNHRSGVEAVSNETYSVVQETPYVGQETPYTCDVKLNDSNKDGKQSPVYVNERGGSTDEVQSVLPCMHLDKISRVAFPLSFLAFNCIYFIFYALMLVDEEDTYSI